MWRSKSNWGWCLSGAYFLAKFQAGGAYSGGAYKKKCVQQNHSKNENIIALVANHLI